jgi:tetratricopeptide (TPR) repeat protein
VPIDTETLHPAVAEAIIQEVDSVLQESQEHWARGEFTQCAEKCKRVADELLGPESPVSLRKSTWQRSASARINGACALKALQRIEDAVEECEKGLKLMESHLIKNRNEVMQILDLLAELCLMCGRIDDAERHIARAIQLKKDFPWRKASLGATLNLQAQAKVQRGEFENARALFSRALDAHVSVAEGAAAKSSETLLPSAAAVVLSNYAGMLRTQSLFGEAVEYYSEAADIFEAQLGPESESLGRTLVELGATYIAAGFGSRATEPLTRALVVLSSALGPDHPSVAATMEWLPRCNEVSPPPDDTLMLCPSQGSPVERLLACSA